MQLLQRVNEYLRMDRPVELAVKYKCSSVMKTTDGNCCFYIINKLSHDFSRAIWNK